MILILGCNQSPENKNVQSTNSDEISNNSTQNFAIVLHGGSGKMQRGKMSPEREAQYKAKLEEAVKTGYKILEDGGSSLEAVEKTINILEDSPLFNAGKGAVFTHEKRNELDASIMDGKTLNAGAVASVTKIKNPITLALSVMEKSKHVMLIGEGAEAFAKEQGFDFVSPSYFHTDKRMKSIERILKNEREKENKDAQSSLYDPLIKSDKFGTVGCVALDKNGNLAAGTSTGGMNNKKWGRVGDSPIVGAGMYANNNTCAVSATGWGEYFIRGVIAHDISALLEYKGLTIKEATTEVVQNKLTKMGGYGGVIALDKDGNISVEFNTKGMFRASIDKNKELFVGIYKD